MNKDQIIDAYIETVDAYGVIAALGARNVKDKDAKWIIHSCIIDEYDQHHTNRDDNPSAAIEQKSKRYSCFSYGVISLKHLLSIVFGEKAFEEKIKFLKELPSVEKHSFKEEMQEALSSKKQETNLRFPESYFDIFEEDVPYMENVRGISKDVYSKHGIKFDKDNNSVVIPLHDYIDGERSVVGCQRRNLNSGMQKYQNSKGLVKESILYYGSDAENAEHIILVESIMSVLKLEEYGYPAVATLGSVVFDMQFSRLIKHRKITIWFDDDYGGMKGVRSFLMMVKNRINVNVVVSDIRHKDPADMTKEEVDRNLQNSMGILEAKPFIESSIVLLRGYGI